MLFYNMCFCLRNVARQKTNLKISHIKNSKIYLKTIVNINILLLFSKQKKITYFLLHQVQYTYTNTCRLITIRTVTRLEKQV